MSAKSDAYEREIAKSIDSINGVNATRPTRGTDYSDVLVTYKSTSAWVEVKMNHTDNLANPRVYYDGRWKTTYTTPAATKAVEFLNSSVQARQFVNNLSKFSGISLTDIKIPTTKSGLKSNGAVPLNTMIRYFSQSGITRYIMSQENYNLGDLVTEHYTIGKSQPAYYMQAGDDFYRISTKNPFHLTSDIPLLSGTGDFKVRVSTRSEFYEVQAEIKIKEMPTSEYSFKPNTKKKNPFFAL
jgi:hypothetical protein